MAETTDQFLISANNFEFRLDRKTVEQLDIVSSSPTSYHIIFKNRSVNVIVHSVENKKLRVEIDAEHFDIEIKDELDLELDQLGFSAVSTRHIKEIKAPMPGLVLEIAVTEGQEVKEGDKILILEAMKMENSIMISADATIKNILIKPGQAVDKGQVLVELD
jgi:biotin carboxyl carrier protein